MGKVSIGLLSCRLLRSAAAPGQLNPMVRMVIDGKYVFSSKVKRRDHNPSYLETFVVGNTHKLALIQVSVFHRDDHGEELLLGTCTVSLKRLARGAEKVREHLLTLPVASHWSSTYVGSLLGSDAVHTSIASCSAPDTSNTAAAVSSSSSSNASIEVTGSIIISLFSDDLGEYHISLNTRVEEEYTRRIRRLCFLYDRSVLNQVDVLIMNVVEPFEQPLNSKQQQQRQQASLTRSPAGGGAQRTQNNNSFAGSITPPIGVTEATTTSSISDPLSSSCTFATVLAELTRRLGPEKPPYIVRCEVIGCENLTLQNEAGHSMAINPFVVMRSAWEQYETRELLATNNPEFPNAAFAFEVLDPMCFSLDVVVMSHIKAREDIFVGAGALTLHCLPKGVTLPRAVPLISDGRVCGILQLQLTAMNFGCIPKDQLEFVSQRVKQLTRFLIRYEPSALPLVDQLVQKNHMVWDSFMMSLVQHYGREPGSVVLEVVIEGVEGLLLNADSGAPLPDGTPIYVALQMGGMHFRTDTKPYADHQEVMFQEKFTIDVSRETDELHLELMDASSQEDKVLGTVDLVALGIQRETHHSRTYTLVGNAGTDGAFCMGNVRVVMKSDQIGVDHEVDHESEVFYTHRLLCLCARYLRPKLHRVDIAIATTEDVETFIRGFVNQYGPEPLYERVAITVDVVKGLGSRYVNMPLHVLCSVGLQRHDTRVSRTGGDREFHETWVIDVVRPENAEDTTSTITTEYSCTAASTVRFACVASSGQNNSSAVATGTIELKSLKPYVDEITWIPLSYRLPEDIVSFKGVIGVRCYVQPITDDVSLSPMSTSVARDSLSRRAAGSMNGRPHPESLSPIRLPSHAGVFSSSSPPFDTTQTPLRTLRRLNQLGGSFALEALSPHLLRQQSTDALRNTDTNNGNSSMSRALSSYPPTSPALNSFGTFTVIVDSLLDLPPAESRGQSKDDNNTGSTGAGVLSHLWSFSGSKDLLVQQQRQGDSGVDNDVVCVCAYPFAPSSSSNDNEEWEEVYRSKSMPYATSVSFTNAQMSVEGSRDALAMRLVVFREYTASTSAMTGGAPSTSSADASPVRRAHVRRRQEIGCCVVSLRGVPHAPLWQTKKLPIVHSARRRCASIQGYIVIKLHCDDPQGGGGGGGGGPAEPSSPVRRQVQATEETESRIRRRVAKFLLANAPKELHLVDMIVSGFGSREDDLMSTLHTQFVKTLQQPKQNAEDDAMNKTILSDIVDTTDLNASASFSDHKKRSCATGNVNSPPPATVTITVKDIRSLMDDGKPLTTQSCYVKVKVGREKFRTKAQSGVRLVAFDDTFTFHMVGVNPGPQNPMDTVNVMAAAATRKQKETVDGSAAAIPTADTNDGPSSPLVMDHGQSGGRKALSELALIDDDPNAIHLTVCRAGPFGRPYGEVYISTKYLQRGVAKERTHMLMSIADHSATGSPTPCGLITIVLSSQSIGFPAPLDEQLEHAAYLRIRSFLKCYVPREMHKLDLYVCPALASGEVDELMHELVERYGGPEPGHNHLEVTAGQCSGTLRTDSSGGGYSRPFVVLHMGISQFQTRSQHAMTETFSFDETFTFDVGLPDQEELTVYLMDETNNGGGDSTEAGRVVVSLAPVRRNAPTKRKLPLVYRAGTPAAVVYGHIELQFRAKDFGKTYTEMSAWESNIEPYRIRVLKMLSRYAPHQLHLYDAVMGQYIFREEDMMKDLVERYGAEPGSFPMYIRVIGLRAAAKKDNRRNSNQPQKSRERSLLLGGCQREQTDKSFSDGLDLGVKVYNNGVQVLKTKPVRIERGMASLRSEDGDGTVMTEVSNVEDTILTFHVYSRGVFSKATLSYADMGVRDLVKDFVNTRWLQLFDLDNGAMLGLIGVEVKSTAFGLPAAKRDDEMCEDVSLDLISVIRKYQPSDLRHLDVFMERAPVLSESHATLRHKYNSEAIGTVYVVVHQVNLSVEPLVPSAAARAKANAASAGSILNLSQPDRDAKAKQKKTNESAHSVPVLWRVGEKKKKISIIGTLCGEVVRCDGECYRDADPSSSTKRTNLGVPPPSAVNTCNDVVDTLRFDICPRHQQQHVVGAAALPPAAEDAATATISSTYNNGGTNPFLTIQVMERKANECDVHLGTFEASIKALLSFEARLYKPEQIVTLPLVLVCQTASSVDAFVTGSVSFSVVRPACELIPKQLTFRSSVVSTMDAAFVWSYFERIERILSHYDPAALQSFHRSFFDVEVGSGRSSATLPQVLKTLLDQWGPEPQGMTSSSFFSVAVAAAA